MGRYVPPDLEGVVSANTASGKGHALGARARKLKSEGIMVVRFECPFAIWCTNCQPEQIIGQGVRFNAEKKKMGNYYTTPIWSFRFKHTVCGGWIEVRTDPKEAEYVVSEGGRRRDLGLDKVLDGEVRLGSTEEDKARLEQDGGFGVLEKKVEDRRTLLSEKGRLEQLEKRSKRDWEDPYEQSKRLRREFRAGRNARKEAAARGEALKDKLSLGIDLVDETAEDRVRAGLVQFGEHAQGPAGGHQAIFSSQSAPAPDGRRRATKPSPADLAAQKRDRLGRQLGDNTRAALDPFLQDQTWQPKMARRKTTTTTTTTTTAKTDADGVVGVVDQNPEPLLPPPPPPPVPSVVALVDYDSDST